MVSSCQDLRDAVVLCLQRSDCVMVYRNTPKQCLQDPELCKTLPESCAHAFMLYMKCRHGRADQSKRFVGNGPPPVGKYQRDLELLRKGDFDPNVERAKGVQAADAPVQSRAEVMIDNVRKSRENKETSQKSWWKWW